MEKSGLYFHIPFCKSKCPYCDFYSVRYDEELAVRYADRIIDEIEQYQGSFDTVYFGGGTPSIIPAELLGKILDASRKHFDIDENSEITVECNPSKDLSEDFKKYASFGIKRISIGMQSARNEERFALGRSAGKIQVEKAISDARRAGIENISLDLMLATPKQTLSSLDESLDFIKSTGVPHISAYMLKIEQGTKFFEMRNKLVLPDEDEVCDMYLKTVEALSDMGLEQYEISNFAKDGFESRHNIKYWTLVPYLGIGKSAHSFWQGERFYYDQNFKKVSDGSGGDKNEKIMLGLRLTRGVEKSLISVDYSGLVHSGLIRETPTHIMLTPQGMLVSNYVINILT